MPFYTVYPVISLINLTREINIKYGFSYNCIEISEKMFGPSTFYDSHRFFYYGEDEKIQTGEGESEANARIRNVIRSCLREAVPDYTVALIDLR